MRNYRLERCLAFGFTVLQTQITGVERLFDGKKFEANRESWEDFNNTIPIRLFDRGLFPGRLKS